MTNKVVLSSMSASWSTEIEKNWSNPSIKNGSYVLTKLKTFALIISGIFEACIRFIIEIPLLAIDLTRFLIQRYKDNTPKNFSNFMLTTNTRWNGEGIIESFLIPIIDFAQIKQNT